MIEARSLRKRYGDLKAVDDVSFRIETGEAFGLLGPNGAGKSTTIHILSGALVPDGGQAFIGGQADPTRAEVRRQIGVAPQALAIYEELTGEENLSVFGKLYGLSGARLKERVSWALEFAGLTDRRRHKAAAYSGGRAVSPTSSSPAVSVSRCRIVISRRASFAHSGRTSAQGASMSSRPSAWAAAAMSPVKLFVPLASSQPLAMPPSPG